MRREPLPGHRFKVSVVLIRGRRWPLYLRIRDRLTGEVTREALSGLTARQRAQAYVQAAEREKMLNGLREGSVAPKTWDEAREALLRTLGAERRPATVQLYRHVLTRFKKHAETVLKRAASPLYLDRISVAIARDYIASRKNSGGDNGRGVENATINKDLRHLKAAWGFWIDQGYAAINPWLKVPRLPEMKRLHVRLDLKQQTRLLHEAGQMGAKFQAALNVALDTGMRGGELSHLTWNHVDVDTAVLLITRELCGWEPKDYEEGVLCFGPDSAMLLRELRNAKIAELIRQGSRDGNEARELLSAARVFGIGHKPGADPWDREFNELLKVCCARAGVPRVTSHDLRRTVARLANAAGASPEDVRTMLRHSSFETTRGYIGDDQVDGARRAFTALRRSQQENAHKERTVAGCFRSSSAKRVKR